MFLEYQRSTYVNDNNEIKDKIPKSKIIIWAHNSHIGDTAC